MTPSTATPTIAVLGAHPNQGHCLEDRQTPDPKRGVRTAATRRTWTYRRKRQQMNGQITTSMLQDMVLPGGLISVLFALLLARNVLGQDRGTRAMQDVAGTIFEGAVAFIRRQYSTIAVMAIVGSIGIGALISVFEIGRAHV